MALVGTYEHLHNDFRLTRGQGLVYRVWVRGPSSGAQLGPLVDLVGQTFQFAVLARGTGARVGLIASPDDIHLPAEFGAVDVVLRGSLTVGWKPGDYLHELRSLQAVGPLPLAAGTLTVLPSPFA